MGREYTTVDKSTWGDGPWRDEPDKVQWVDEATGLDCLIVRGPSGALCGYVGVPPEHPWHGVDYDAGEWDGPERERSPSYVVDVHGGLTYAAACSEGETESVGICHVPEPGRPDNVWWFGFDCAHSGDQMPDSAARLRAAGMGSDSVDPYSSYKTVGYVRREVMCLAAQIRKFEGASA